MEEVVQKILNYSNPNEDSKLDILDATKKISMQVVLHKIQNIKNEKQVLCKLPNPILDLNTLDACLIVKDVNKRSRDFDQTTRSYEKFLSDNDLDKVIKHVLPVKQIKLEFRPFEAKRKLCSSYDLFISDEKLHSILFHGSKLGKEFRKKKKMPIPVDLDKPNAAETIKNIFQSTVIHLNGKGPLIDIPAFLNTHTVEQAVKNIECIRAKLTEVLAGGDANIKTIYLKLKNSISIPIYISDKNPNEVKMPNNVTPEIKKKSARQVKRLKSKSKEVEKKTEKKPKKNLAKKKLIKNK